MGNDNQVIAFFAPRKVEIPSTMFLINEKAMRRTKFYYPSLAQVEAALIVNLNLGFLPIAEDSMDTSILLLLTPIPPQWALELDGKNDDANQGHQMVP